MKKRFIIIGIIVIVLIALFIIWLLAPTPAPERIQNIILENEADYTRIAEIYYKDYLSNHERLSKDVMAYSEAFSAGETYKICSNDILPNTRDISLNESESASAQAVADSYWIDESFWERVYVYDVFVSFSNIRGRESLVYSVDGTRPSYVDTPSDEDKFDHIWVHKITDNWYHVRGE